MFWPLLLKKFIHFPISFRLEDKKMNVYFFGIYGNRKCCNCWSFKPGENHVRNETKNLSVRRLTDTANHKDYARGSELCQRLSSRQSLPDRLKEKFHSLIDVQQVKRIQEN